MTDTPRCRSCKITSFWKNGEPWLIVEAQSRAPEVKRRID
jgi:hypothetical protein